MFIIKKKNVQLDENNKLNKQSTLWQTIYQFREKNIMKEFFEKNYKKDVGIIYKEITKITEDDELELIKI